jgi:hypothetical protein
VARLRKAHSRFVIGSLHVSGKLFNFLAEYQH